MVVFLNYKLQDINFLTLSYLLHDEKGNVLMVLCLLSLPSVARTSLDLATVGR